jgi:type I restriction enzyme S subunit
MMEEKLPKGWKLLPLSEVVEILDNLRVPVSSSERAKRIGDIPYYGATGQTGWIDDHIFDEELVLLGEDGAPFFDKKKNVAYLINGKSWVNNHAHVLRAKPKKTENKYAYYFLNHFDYAGFVGGTTRLKLTQGNLKSIPIPIPPLAEQQRIVAKLDSLFGHLDSLREKLDRIPGLLKNFRQQVLNQAVTGELTRVWRENVNLNNEEEFIENEDLEMRDIKYEIPESWQWLPFSKVADVKSNLVQPEEYFDYPLIAPDNIESNTGKLLNKPFVHEILPKSPKHYFHEGDIVYSKIRPYLSKLIIAEFDGLCSADMYPISSTSLNIRYLFYYMLSDVFLRYATTAGERSVLPKINQKELAIIPISVPSIQEQEEIITRIDDLLDIADKIESQYQSLKAKIDQLPQAILAKAFRGELVEQEAKAYKVEEGVGLMAAEGKAGYGER